MATIMIELEPLRAARRSHTAPQARRPTREVYLRRRLAAGVALLTLFTVAGLATRTLSESPGGIPASAPGRTPAAAAGAGPSGGPPVATYLVQPGDTLWSIAEALGVHGVAGFVDEVAELNGGASLEVGQLLVLPG